MSPLGDRGTWLTRMVPSLDGSQKRLPSLGGRGGEGQLNHPPFLENSTLNLQLSTLFQRLRHG